MEKHQVVIVGAGPAGASCAKALHDAGVEALIIEVESLPRHKTCSGVLFGQTQELLLKLFGSLPPEEIYCEPKTIQASQIIEWKGGDEFIQYFWEIPKNGHVFPQTYCNIHRGGFDQGVGIAAAIHRIAGPLGTEHAAVPRRHVTLRLPDPAGRAPHRAGDGG